MNKYLARRQYGSKPIRVLLRINLVALICAALLAGIVSPSLLTHIGAAPLDPFAQRTVGLLAWLLPAPDVALAAPIAPHPNTEIVLGINYDGTAPFAGSAADEDGQGGHNAGDDSAADNNVVRTFDLISYRVDWNVNEVDATGTAITMTLPAAIPEVVWKEIPAGCDLVASAISNSDQTLVCDLGDQREGSSGTIHALAEVASTRVGIDGDVITLNATIETDQSSPVTSNSVSTTISAAPALDWVKLEPRVYSNITRTVDSELGRIFTFPIYLAPEGGGRGSEPLDDTVAIQLFDHLYDYTNNTGVLPGEIVTDTAAYIGDFDNRVCGAYTGDGNEMSEHSGAAAPLSMPYGISGLGSADQTASGAASITCSDATGSSTYPIVQLDISGHDTTVTPPQAANGDLNSAGVVIAIQVPFFVPESHLFPSGAASAYIHNAITGDSTTFIPDAVIATDPNTVTVAIPVVGAATITETTTANNAVATLVAYAEPGGGGARYVHWVRFQRGPYQEHRIPVANTDMYFAGYDQRLQSTGGMGRNGLYPDNPELTGWDFAGPVSRDQSVTLMLGVAAAHPNVAYLDSYQQAIHGCMYIDTEHMELVDFPSAFAVKIVDGLAVTSGTPLGATTGSPSDGLFHLNYGDDVTSLGHNILNVSGLRISPGFQPEYVIEVATAATPFGGAYADGAVQCDEDDANVNGWTAITTGSNLAPFDSDNNGTYDLIDMVRVRTLEPLRWLTPFRSPTDSSGVNLSNKKAGAQFHLFAQARVKETIADAANGDDIHIHASRARGEWPLASAAPTAPLSSFDCRNSGFPTWNPNPTGWCNLGTAQPVEKTQSGYVQLAHMDRLVVTGPQLNINKENVAGLTDIVENGDLVTFSIDVGITGGADPADEMANIILTDTLEAHYGFVSLQQPTTGSCSGTSSIVCSFGDRVAPWTDSYTVTVRVQNAGANQPLTNTVLASGINGGVVFTTTNTAYAYTPGAFHQLDIRHEVEDLDGDCTQAPGVTAHSQGDCSVTDIDGQMIFTIYYTNTGTAELENVHVINVLPHVADTAEPQTTFQGLPISAITGDGRTPPSAFSGTISLVSATDSNGFPIEHTVDAIATVDRNPATNNNTWIAGTASAATGLRMVIPTLTAGMTGTVSLVYDTLGNVNDDIYTSNFGAQAFGCAPVNNFAGPSLVPGPSAPNALTAGGSGATYVGNRSNDVSAMVYTELRVGNRIWYDANDNGVIDGFENSYGIDGVTVELLDSNGAVISTTTTANGGYYLFKSDSNGDLLNSDDYRVRIPATGNMGAAGSALPLDDWRSSTDDVVANSADPNSDVDSDDNGAGTTANTDITTGAISVTVGTEPASASDGDDTDGNLTVDFGFYDVCDAGAGDLGGHIFRDFNSDGVNDSGEPGWLAGITVTAYDNDGNAYTTTINPDGS